MGVFLGEECEEVWVKIRPNEETDPAHGKVTVSLAVSGRMFSGFKRRASEGIIHPGQSITSGVMGK